MKIYSLEFISSRDGAAERIWHTNLRALERYSGSLQQAACQVRGITAYEMPTPLTEARMVAFLNSNCRAFMPADGSEPADGAAAQPTGEVRSG